MSLIGKSIGRYHILEQLGLGGMAIVYKAYDTRLEREVAIKIIRKDAFPAEVHERVLKRFEREAKSLAKMSHANIVKVHDFGDYDGAPYLVMELLTGGTLKAFTGQPMPYQEAACLLEPIARALAYAHQQGVLHRDVKPANILIAENGEPILTDFGIAKLLENEEGQTLTGTGFGVGTPEYMAPEQGLGKEIDGRADIYGLGIVFYELVTGRKPYLADTPFAVLLKQVNDPLPRPKELNPNLISTVENVLLKALAKNPSDRFHSMNEFAQVLEKLSKETSISDMKSHLVIKQTLEEPEDVGLETFDLIISDEGNLSIRSDDKVNRKSQVWWKWGLGVIFLLSITAGIYCSLLLLRIKSAQAEILENNATVPVSEDASINIVDQKTNSQPPIIEEILSTQTPIPIDPLVVLFEDFEDGKTQDISYISGNWQIVTDETGNKVYEIDNSKSSSFPGIDFGSEFW
jgi:serine/threonine protein kinase